MSSDDSWKAKYLREQEALAARERDWETERHLLGRLLVRTSLASEGQSRDLDDLLGQLRSRLRGDQCDLDGLKTLQAALDQQLTLLDDSKTAQLGKLTVQLSGLFTTLRENALFAGEHKALKGLEKRWKNPDSRRGQWPEWVAELAALLDRALAGDADAQPERPGLLDRLFGGGRVAGSTPTAETPVVAESLTAAAGSTGEPSGEDQQQRLRMARRISELLGQMLAQLMLDPAAHARAEILRDHLAQSTDWQELRGSLNEVADLLVVAVQRGQREFEAFLKRLDDRLLALQDHFVDQSDALAGAQCASRVFDEGLRSELQALGEQVGGASDVHELKHSVSLHLESISAAMARYREGECQREKRLSDQLHAMKEKVAALEAYSEQIKVRLKEERARALTDVLTQLPNREAWQERMDFELTRWQRYRHPFTVGILDIDLFKRINDSYGHKAGDRVIQLVAKTLSDRLRNTDFVARYGGEEFVLMMPETDAEAAKKVVEGLREQVAQLPFHFAGEPVTITFSAGLTELQEADDLDQLFERADKALYLAKSRGRNQVCTGPDEPVAQ